MDRLSELLVTAALSSNVQVAGVLAPLVMLDSDGGDVAAAITMGRRLRSVNAFVVVGVNAECSSACVLIFAARAKRLVSTGARLGLHRPYFEESYFAGLSSTQAREKYAELERVVKDYLKELSMPEALFEKMRSIPSRRLVYLKDDDIKELGLDGADAAIEELERAREKEHFASDPAMYEYLNDLRNCADLGRPYEVCQEIVGQKYKRSKGVK